MTGELTALQNEQRVRDSVTKRDHIKQILVKAADEIGPLRQLELTGTIPYMFAEIGKRNSSRIQSALEYKESKDLDGVYRRKSEQTLANLKTKLQFLQKTNSEIAGSLNLYLLSLKAWADGADIAESEAWFMQDESFGCQTVMVRGENGEVFLGHSEEWYMEQEEKEKTGVISEWTIFIDVSDPSNPDKLEAFTGYPFALPGSSFGVHNGHVMAVDSLDVKRTGKSIPANVAAWVAWHLAGKVEPEEIFKILGPFADGYAYNEIYFNDQAQMVEAKTIEFTGAQISTVFLPKPPMSFWIQTNEAETSSIRSKKGQNLKPDDLKYYAGIRETHSATREAWRKRVNNSKNNILPHITMDSLRREFSLIPNNPSFDVIPKEYTYAHFFAVVKPDGSIETSINPGPAIQK